MKATHSKGLRDYYQWRPKVKTGKLSVAQENTGDHRRASRLICGPDKEYPERLLELKWDSLELRRQYLSLVQMYKIIFGYCDINCHHYFDIIGITRTRSKHEYKIRPKVARTNYFKYSFFNRYINDWNCLPSEVMSSPSLQSFKVSPIKYLRSKLPQIPVFFLL